LPQPAQVAPVKGQLQFRSNTIGRGDEKWFSVFFTIEGEEAGVVTDRGEDSCRFGPFDERFYLLNEPVRRIDVDSGIFVGLP
jgi:hypothetical protein